MAQESTDKQYFVEVQYTWGKQVGDDQNVESIGSQNWGYLTYEQSVALNAVIADSLKKLLDDSVELGLSMIDAGLADQVRKGRSAG